MTRTPWPDLLAGRFPNWLPTDHVEEVRRFVSDVVEADRLANKAVAATQGRTSGVIKDA
jgi:hypothetical protein